MNAPRTLKKIWFHCPASPSLFGMEKLGKAKCAFRYFPQLNSLCDTLHKTVPLKELLLVLDVHRDDEPLRESLRSARMDPSLTVILSSRNEPAIVRKWLDFGVLDYMVHPVDPNILWVKAERALGLHIEHTPHKQQIPLLLDSFAMTARMPGTVVVKLTVKEFQLLTQLLRAYPQGVSRLQIQEEIWGGVKVVAKTLDVHLFRLRKKLAEIGLEVKHQAGKESYFTLEELSRSK